MARITGGFLFILTLATLTSIVSGQTPPIPRVALVSSAGDPRAPGPLIEAFQQTLRELGYTEGKNIEFDFRFAEGKLDRVPALVEDAVRRNPAALVVSSMSAARAAKRTTSTVPIVMLITADPVAIGMVKSLARPGENITGIVSPNRDLRREGLDALKEAAPAVSRVGILWNVEGRVAAAAVKDYENAAALRNIQVQSLEVRGDAPDLSGAFAAAGKAHADALIAVSDPALVRYAKQIAELSLQQRLPSLSERVGYAAAGGLLEYSADYVENFRRLAVYVDRILKGAKAAELPIEKSKFHLAVNLKTAKQIGLVVPPDLLRRADKVMR